MVGTDVLKIDVFLEGVLYVKGVNSKVTMLRGVHQPELTKLQFQLIIKDQKSIKLAQ